MILPAYALPRSFGRLWPGRTGHVAETPPPWTAPQPFTAELALRDLEAAPEPDAVERIVARYAVARLALGDPAAVRARTTETVAARSYVEALPRSDTSASLAALLRRTTAGAPDAHWFRAAGEAAAAEEHWCGGFLLLRAAFRRARAAGDRTEAARSARAIARLAKDAGAGPAARAWQRRARRLERPGNADA